MRFLLLAVFIIFSFATCAPSGKNDNLVVASYETGEIRVSDLRDYLSTPVPGSSNPKSQERNLEWFTHKVSELFQIKTQIDEDELLYLKTNAAFQKQLERTTRKMLAEAYLDRVMPHFVVDEADIQAFLLANAPEAVPERRAVQNIFLRYPANADTTAKAAVKAQAEKLLEQIRAGAPFGQLAREYSDSATAQRGGSFGYVLRSDLREPLSSVVFSMQEGELSEVVINDGGCHIFFLKHIVGNSEKLNQKRRRLAENRLYNTMKRDWAKVHLTELLINRNLQLPDWPHEPASDTGIIFTLNDQTVTEPEMMKLAPNYAALQETFLKHVGELVFADELSQLNPEVAGTIRRQAEELQAYRNLRRESLLAEIKAFPEQKLYDHYLQHQNRFRTPERLAIQWYGWPLGEGDPNQYFEVPRSFANRLKSGENPGKPPELSEKIGPMTRRDFRFAHKDLAPHLPEILAKGTVIPPFRLANLILVMQVVTHQPAQAVPYNNLIDQVPNDYFRVHAKTLEKTWFAKTQERQGLKLNKKHLQAFMEVWQQEQNSPSKSS